jgi:hypothetical protein
MGVDHTGRDVTQPQMEASRSEVKDLDRGNSRRVELAMRLKTRSQGSPKGIDLRTEQPATFVIVRVPAPSWSLEAGVPHPGP